MSKSIVYSLPLYIYSSRTRIARNAPNLAH